MRICINSASKGYAFLYGMGKVLDISGGKTFVVRKSTISSQDAISQDFARVGDFIRGAMNTYEKSDVEQGSTKSEQQLELFR